MPTDIFATPVPIMVLMSSKTNLSLTETCRLAEINPSSDDSFISVKRECSVKMPSGREMGRGTDEGGPRHERGAGRGACRRRRVQEAARAGGGLGHAEVWAAQRFGPRRGEGLG